MGVENRERTKLLNQYLIILAPFWDIYNAVTGSFDNN